MKRKLDQVNDDRARASKVICLNDGLLSVVVINRETNEIKLEDPEKLEEIKLKIMGELFGQLID